MFWRWLVPQQFKRHRLYLNSPVWAFSFPLHHFLDILESRATGRAWRFSFSAVYRHTHTCTHKHTRRSRAGMVRFASREWAHPPVMPVLLGFLSPLSLSFFFFLMWNAGLACYLKSHGAVLKHTGVVLCEKNNGLMWQLAAFFARKGLLRHLNWTYTTHRGKIVKVDLPELK